MRNELGVLLVESETGEVSVQLFSDPGKAREIFQQLNNSTRLRATFITVDWKKKTVEAMEKELPIDLRGERMEGWRVGVGPIFSVTPVGIQSLSGDIEGKKES